MKVYTKISLFGLMFALMFISCKKDESEVELRVVEASFETSADTVFLGSFVKFTNTSKNAQSYQWNFDNSGALGSTDENPEYQFTNVGTYEVRLIAISDNGSSDIVTKSIVVLSYPTKAKVTKVVVEKFPFTDGSGNNWDPTAEGDAPDLYFKFANTGGSVVYNHSFLERIENVPQSSTCTWDSLDLQIYASPYPAQSYDFELYDYDPSDADDLLAEISYYWYEFWPNIVSTSSVKYYPSEVTLSNATTTIKLTVEWLP